MQKYNCSGQLLIEKDENVSVFVSHDTNASY